MANRDEPHESWVPELNFSARLALVRNQMGWNIKEAAIACRLPPQSWRSWEQEKRLPRDILNVARRVSERTGVNFSWLLTGHADEVSLMVPAPAHAADTGDYPWVRTNLPKPGAIGPRPGAPPRPPGRGPGRGPRRRSIAV